MKTIGQFLKDSRVAKKLSVDDLESATKIKATFIRAIENEEWHTLPEFPVVLGFVKNIASHIDVAEKQAMALLRRDYPPKVLSINPKPDVSNKFNWTPRLTFITGIVLILAALLAYLGIQYTKFTSPPLLSVERPVDEEVIKEPKFMVSGKVDPEASVKVNNQPALVEENGTFTAEIEISEETTDIIVRATSRAGKETTISRKIVVDFN